MTCGRAARVAVLDASERFDGVRPASLRVPAAVIAAALDVVTPAGPGRADRVDRPGPGRPHGAIARREGHPDRAGRDRHPALGSGPSGRALRPGRSRAVPVERGDERGSRAGRRGAGDRRDVAAAAGQRRLAGPERAGRLRAAGHRRGLRGRRRAGHRPAGAGRGRCRRRRDRAGRRDHRSRECLRDGRQTAAARHRRDRLGGRPDRDRRRRRRFRRCRIRCGGPDLAGRARPAGRLGADHHLGRAGR